MGWGKLNWVETGGGPFILIPAAHASEWKGSLALTTEQNGERTQDQDSYGNALTDYERACEINDFIGVIPVGNIEALILADEPLATTWLPQTSCPGGVLVRWMNSEDEEVIISRKSEILRIEGEVPIVTLRIFSSPVLLFDSSMAGSEFGETDSLLIELSPGDYRVSSGIFEPDKELSLLLHRFTLVH